MSSGSYTNSDGLYLQIGTAKAVPETGGEYLMYGPNRIAEVTLNLSTITAVTTATIISNTLFFPMGQNLFVEKVEAITEIAMSSAGSPTLTIGFIQDDRTTVPAGGASAFISAVTSTAFTTAGNIVSYSVGTAGVGGFVGNYNTQWNTNTSGTNSVGGYITASLGATTATGQIKIRIYYHGVGTISN
jgi:hypothetical protein